MRTERRLVVRGTRMGEVIGATVALVMVVACTSIGATPQPGSSTVTPLPAESIGASLPATFAPASLELPTVAPATELPTNQPSVPPTTAPAPTKTPKAGAANLVVTKFELDANYILVETQTDFIATVRNTGTAAAGPFKAAVATANEVDGTKGQSDPVNVQAGLAAGKTVKVTIPLALPKAGYWKLTATADSANAVAESDETDNGRDLPVKVLIGLPDVMWANKGLSMTASQTRPGYYDTAVDIINRGTDELAQQAAFISLTWYRDEDSASGTLHKIPLTDMANGEERVLESQETFPGPGSYTVYAYIDSEHVLNELSTDNNETSIKVIVPSPV